MMEDVICKQYKISASQAKIVNRDVGFYVHGLATQICYGCIKYNNFEIYDLIKNKFLRFLNIAEIVKQWKKEKRKKKKEKEKVYYY